MTITINGNGPIVGSDRAEAGVNDDITSLAAVSSVNGGQLAGMRNKIINGKMDVSQRGTSFISGSSLYTLDRWIVDYVADGGATTSQAADAPSSNEFQNSLRLITNTADVSIAASQYARFEQKIEGYNARDLLGRTFTLSFLVRSSKTGVHCIALRNSGSDRSYVSEYVINSANTWEKKSITVSGGLITAGTWNWTNGAGLQISFAMASGTTFHTAAGAWQTGNFLATANQVNCLDTVGNIFAITGVQLEVGTVATPFEHRPYGMELALCQRYYTSLAKGQIFHATGLTSGVTVGLSHQVSMRTSPSISTSIVDANFSTVGSPPANTWGLQIVGVGVITKTGTAGISFSADTDRTTLYIYAATFSSASNALYLGAGIFINASAEL